MRDPRVAEGTCLFCDEFVHGSSACLNCLYGHPNFDPDGFFGLDRQDDCIAVVPSLMSENQDRIGPCYGCGRTVLLIGGVSIALLVMVEIRRSRTSCTKLCRMNAGF